MLSPSRLSTDNFIFLRWQLFLFAQSLISAALEFAHLTWRLITQGRSRGYFAQFVRQR